MDESTTSLVDRLRQPCGWCDLCKDCERLMDEAADKIEQLQADLSDAKGAIHE